MVIHTTFFVEMIVQQTQNAYIDTAAYADDDHINWCLTNIQVNINIT